MKNKDVAKVIAQIQRRLDVLAEAIIRRTVCVAGITDTRSIAAIRSEVSRMKTELQTQLEGGAND